MTANHFNSPSGPSIASAGFRLLSTRILALFKRWIKLLEIPAPEAPQWLRRISVMERDIMLPVKAVGILMLYLFYFTSWTGYAHTALEIDIEAIDYFFWVYVGVNVLAAVLFLQMRRLPLTLMQWVVFVMILIDGLFLSALTLVTGGYESILYWLFLGLIVRSAVSVPRATSQIMLNLTLVTCYVLAGVIEISIAKDLEEHVRADLAIERMLRRAADLGLTSPRARSRSNLDGVAPAGRSNVDGELSLLSRTNAAAGSAGRPRTLPPLFEDWEEQPAASLGLLSPTENTAEPLVMRLILLLLMTVCAYGVQVLLERQRQVEEEAREFGLREGQLRSAARLAAEFAHQIKNPLAIINNASYSLQRALKQGKTEAAEQLRIIQEEVEHSDRIITQIVGYAQLTEGRVEKLDVLEELDGAIERVFPPAAGFPVRIQREYGLSFPPLLMQRTHLSETFVNILQNAREAFNGAGGVIQVKAHCRGDYAIEVSIQDNGPGIPADKLGRIFEAYYTTKEKGTGLGLATVKHNVELYGGTVSVQSELGKGARFTLVFPAKTLLRLTKAK